MTPTKWKLAWVIELHPSNDRNVRVIIIRVENRKQTRFPVVNLCCLPTTEKDQEVEKL
jgi:hypothetical protein